MTPPTAKLELVLEHQGFVRALARDLVADEDMARDVEQDTWLAALSGEPRDQVAARAWLAGIVRRVVSKAWRSRLRRADRELAAARESRPIAAPAELLERESSRREIVEAVVALDEPWRSALIARYFDELSPERAAKHFDIPIETLRTRLKRGRELLRERLAQRHHRTGRSWAQALVVAWSLERPTLAPRGTAALQAWVPAWVKGACVVGAAKETGLAAAVVVVIAASWWWIRSDGAGDLPSDLPSSSIRPDEPPIAEASTVLEEDGESE